MRCNSYAKNTDTLVTVFRTAKRSTICSKRPNRLYKKHYLANLFFLECSIEHIYFLECIQGRKQNSSYHNQLIFKHLNHTFMSWRHWSEVIKYQARKDQNSDQLSCWWHKTSQYKIVKFLWIYSLRRTYSSRMRQATIIISYSFIFIDKSRYYDMPSRRHKSCLMLIKDWLKTCLLITNISKQLALSSANEKT